MRVQDIIDYMRFKRRFDLMGIFSFLKLLICKFQKKELILINAAAGLGDYLWIRNYFKLIKESPQHKNSAIILLATERWLRLSKKIDNGYVDIFMNFHNPNMALFTETFLLRCFKFDTYINFFPEGNLHKEINKYATSNNKITCDIVDQKGYTNEFYQKRNDLIMSQFVDIPQNFKHELPIIDNASETSKDYIVLVPAGFAMGELSDEQLKTITDFVDEKFRYAVLLLGLKNHKPVAKRLKKIVNNPKNLINGCGKFYEYELPSILEGAKLVITPNTATYHMALMLDKNIICFSKENPMSLDFEKNNVEHIISDKEISDIPSQKIVDLINKMLGENN
ncbi:MAG: hypothetical protein PHV37_05505 [Candidatus Gastranaerophilales bacterium]|nr:hypothetical protein [Candidatus Gastranaerophilales bacterium]